MTKDEARRIARIARKNCKAQDELKAKQAQAPNLVANHFENEILPKLNHEKDIIAMTLTLGSELDLTELRGRLWQKGFKIALPRVDKNAAPLLFHLYQQGDKLIDESFGTKAPSPLAPIVAPTLFLTPFLAYDKKGYRLGYGGGFYDRTIADYRQNGRFLCTVGVGYKAQEWEFVPHDYLDQSLDYILNEDGLITITNQEFSPF